MSSLPSSAAALPGDTPRRAAQPAQGDREARLSERPAPSGSGQEAARTPDGAEAQGDISSSSAANAAATPDQPNAQGTTSLSSLTSQQAADFLGVPRGFRRSDQEPSTEQTLPTHVPVAQPGLSTARSDAGSTRRSVGPIRTAQPSPATPCRSSSDLSGVPLEDAYRREKNKQARPSSAAAHSLSSRFNRRPRPAPSAAARTEAPAAAARPQAPAAAARPQAQGASRAQSQSAQATTFGPATFYHSRAAPATEASRAQSQSAQATTTFSSTFGHSRAAPATETTSLAPKLPALDVAGNVPVPWCPPPPSPITSDDEDRDEEMRSNEEEEHESENAEEDAEGDEEDAEGEDDDEGEEEEEEEEEDDEEEDEEEDEDGDGDKTMDVSSHARNSTASATGRAAGNEIAQPAGTAPVRRAALALALPAAAGSALPSASAPVARAAPAARSQVKPRPSKRLKSTSTEASADVPAPIIVPRVPAALPESVTDVLNLHRLLRLACRVPRNNEGSAALDDFLRTVTALDDEGLLDAAEWQRREPAGAHKRAKQALFTLVEVGFRVAHEHRSDDDAKETVDLIRQLGEDALKALQEFL